MNCLAHEKKNAQPLDVNLALKKDAIFKLPRPHQGQVAYAIDTNETYIYNEGWQVLGDVKMEGNGLQMSLYELNRSIMEQLPPLADYEKAINTINEIMTEINCEGKIVTVYSSPKGSNRIERNGVSI